MEDSIVKVEHLSHRYHIQWAIQDINFEIKEKGVLGLLGSNGAGKSTTMNIICGVLNQTEGEVYLNGYNLRTNPVEAKRHIGFLPQKPPLYPDITVEEYLTYAANLRLMNTSEIPAAVEKAMKRCDITHFRERIISNLSGGYQQRVGIAQAIVHNPRFVVLDEPTNGLDPNQIVEIRHLIKEIATDHAVLLSTHILSEVQATCNNIKMIEQGKLVFSGSMDEFNNYVAPSTLLITLDAAPPVSTLEAIEGVARVEKVDPRNYRLQFDASKDISEQVVQLSVANGWQLSEIQLERQSLDAIFAQLSGKKVQQKMLFQSMKTILKITKNELSTLFYSPIAWLILIIFTFQSGMAYANAWDSILRSVALGYNPSSLTGRLLLGWEGAKNITGDLSN